MSAFKVNLENTSYTILLILLFLLPIFISPVGLVSFLFAKSALIVVLTSLSFILLILSILKKGSVRLPKNWPMLSMLLVPLVVLISSLFSASVPTSLLGYGTEIDTLFMILTVFILMFTVSQLFTTARRILYAQIVFLLPILILFIFHGIRLIFGPETLSLGSFNLITSNTFGGWNDFAIFSALVVILVGLLLEITKVTKQVKVVSYILFALAVAFLIVVNFLTVWLVLGIFSLVSFVYLFSSSENRRVPLISSIVLGLSILFLIAGDKIGGMTDSFFGINILDQGPSWFGTVEVIKGSFYNLKNILIGTGPNTFSFNWPLFKPLGVNETALWNANFNHGISYLSTTIITTGVLGALSWLAFIIFFVYQGFRLSAKNSFLKYLSVSSFVVSLFLWIVLLIYVPGIVVFTLTFFFTGLFLASLVATEVVETKEISFTNKPRSGFAITLALVFVLIISVNLVYISSQKTLSFAYYQKALQHLNQEGDVLAAEEDINQSISFAKHDFNYQVLSDINLIRFNQIVNTEDIEVASVISRAQQALGNAISNSKLAISARPLNYQNYVTLGNVYASVAPPPLSVEGAAKNAREAYAAAANYAPKNPRIPLAFARLEAGQGNIEEVRGHISKALELKSNYTEAAFTLAQIEVQAGNIDEAISSVEVATVIEPNNPVLYFQLGLLYYNKESYREAVVSFEDAIDLIPDYSNARYFLGLSYYELDRAEDAILQFEQIELVNPGNEEVEFILGNLRAGRAPFEEVAPPLDDEPENREDLPIDEE